MLAPHTSCVLLAILASGSAMSATSVVSPAILRVWVEEAAPLLANCLDDQNHLQPLLSSSTEKEEALRQTAPPFVLGRAPLESWRSFRSSSSSTCASLMTNASRPHTPVAALLGNLQRCASPWWVSAFEASSKIKLEWSSFLLPWVQFRATAPSTISIRQLVYLCCFWQTGTASEKSSLIMWAGVQTNLRMPLRMIQPLIVTLRTIRTAQTMKVPFFVRCFQQSSC